MIEDDYCDLCETKVAGAELRPRRISTRFLKAIPEGLVCRDQDACSARREARKSRERDALEQSRISDPHPSHYTCW